MMIHQLQFRFPLKKPVFAVAISLVLLALTGCGFESGISQIPTPNTQKNHLDREKSGYPSPIILGKCTPFSGVDSNGKKWTGLGCP